MLNSLMSSERLTRAIGSRPTITGRGRAIGADFKIARTDKAIVFRTAARGPTARSASELRVIGTIGVTGDRGIFAPIANQRPNRREKAVPRASLQLGFRHSLPKGRDRAAERK